MIKFEINKFKKGSSYLDANGFTLLGVLMILVLFSVLGVSLLAVTSNSLKLSGNERTDQSTFYIAEAGIVVTRKDIEDNCNWHTKYAYEKTRTTIKKHKMNIIDAL